MASNLIVSLDYIEIISIDGLCSEDVPTEDTELISLRGIDVFLENRCAILSPSNSHKGIEEEHTHTHTHTQARARVRVSM